MRFAWLPLSAPALALAFAATSLTGCPSGDVTRPPATPAPVEPAPPVPPPSETGRLPTTATPTRYELSLSIDPATDRFSGDVTIDVEIPQRARAIVLHGRELSVIRADVFVAGRPVRAQAAFRTAKGGKAEEEMVLTLGETIPAGPAQIKIAYSAPLADKLAGLYRVQEDGLWYVFSQLEATDARRMMPCFDEPGYKTPLTLKVTVPKGNLVVANAEEASRAEVDDGKSTRFTFAPTLPLPTYLMALAVGPFDVREGAAEPVKIRVITTRGRAGLGTAALEAAQVSVRALGSYFDRPYPYSKLDLLAVPDFGYGAMENAGLITFRDDILLLDDNASKGAWRNMAETVAHETAHHWFGDLVTMAWWNDVWLNEGFATWMETKVVDQWRPETEARLDALAARGSVMQRDALGSSRAIREGVVSTSDIDAAFDAITYQKGAAVIGMLEGWLGEDTFRDGVRAYVRSHEHKHATNADLIAALSKASGKDVGAVASTFLDQPGLPLVRAELTCEAQKPAKVTLSQSPYSVHKAADAPQRWKIPVCVAYEGEGQKKPACGLLEEAPLSLPLPGKSCPKWIYPNAGGAGYYRFALSQGDWSKLVASAASLDLPAKIGLVSNAWALVQSGDLTADQLFDLLSGLRRERHRLVVGEIVNALWAASEMLVDETTRPGFEAFVAATLGPLAREMGWEKRAKDSDDDERLRRTVLGALGALTNDPWMQKEATKRADAFAKDPKSVRREIAPLALSIAARSGDASRWDGIVAFVEKVKTPEDRSLAVAALGAFGSPELLRKSLDLVRSGRLRMQDLSTLADEVSQRRASRPVFYAWVKEHMAELKTKLPSFFVARFADLPDEMCTAAERADAETFLTGALAEVEGAERPLKQALEASQNCIDLRAREAERMKKRFGKKK